MENNVPTCRLCSQLEQTLRSAQEQRTDLLGLTEIGKRSRVQQQEERILKAVADLERHQQSDRCLAQNESVQRLDSLQLGPTNCEDLFREILKSAEEDIETLEAKKTLLAIEDLPTPAERSAIERIQETLKALIIALEDELPK